MGFLERAIRRGVSDAVGKAIGKAIEPTVTDLTNKAANAIGQAAQNTEHQVQRSSGLEGAMANLERSVQTYATEAAKKVKVCPSCQKATSADKKFCPDCGAQLPEQTAAQGAVCLHCGKQNTIGTKFCQDCGAKLSAAVQEEEAAARRDAVEMARWDTILPHYPKWICGGTKPAIDEYDTHFSFCVTFNGNSHAARQAVAQYRQILMQNGFQPAGQHPCPEQLYKRIDGTVYHVDTEHCFDGDPDCPAITFDNAEPYGGFGYKKPETGRKSGLRNLFSL